MQLMTNKFVNHSVLNEKLYFTTCKNHAQNYTVAKTVRTTVSRTWKYAKVEMAPPMTQPYLQGSVGKAIENTASNIANGTVSFLDSQIKAIDAAAAQRKRDLEAAIKAAAEAAAKKAAEEKARAEAERLKAIEAGKLAKAAKAEAAKTAAKTETKAKVVVKHEKTQDKKAEAKKSEAKTEKKPEVKKPEAKKPEPPKKK